jgi:hypothetical protein
MSVPCIPGFFNVSGTEFDSIGAFALILISGSIFSFLHQAPVSRVVWARTRARSTTLVMPPRAYRARKASRAFPEPFSRLKMHR